MLRYLLDTNIVIAYKFCPMTPRPRSTTAPFAPPWKNSANLSV